MSMTANIEGERLAFIGIGGGSDCIQAAILAELAQKPACVISIRTEKTGSQGLDGKMGQTRTIENHGGEVSEGVFKITPETTGVGRFLEPIPSADFPVYAVIDKQDGTLNERIQAALADFGGVESIVAVDTGGDSLYRKPTANQAAQDKTKATPDQDLASLEAISKIEGIKLYSSVLAVGVDSPEYADEILQKANAQFFTPDESEKEIILKTYRKWEMDGQNLEQYPIRYGKTPFAWQAALRGERGRTKLPIPEALINHPTNPWNPYVNITDEMAGGYLMDLHAHLAAISEPKNRHLPDDFQPKDAGSLTKLGLGNITKIGHSQ